MRVEPASGPLRREDLIMALGYRPVNRDQMMLLPPDLRDWLSPQHFVWFLLAVLDEVDVGGFEAGRRLGSVGREGYDPRMLLGLVIYGYAHGQRSSRRIEELCSTDVAFRVICAQDAPDHTTIARFRQANDEAVAELFVRVLELAGEAGLGRVGVIAVDGTRIAANASWAANRRRSWLREQVKEAMAEAERVDTNEDARFGVEVNGGEVDQCWIDPATRAGRIKTALARAEQLVEQQSAAQDARVASWQDRVVGAAERHGREWTEPSSGIGLTSSSKRPRIGVRGRNRGAVRLRRRIRRRPPGRRPPSWTRCRPGETPRRLRRRRLGQPVIRS